MEIDSAEERYTRRDRAARLMRVATLLYHYLPHGLTAREVARHVDVNVRTAYRDLHAIERELGFPVWQEQGRWVIGTGDFLPPLKLTPLEAVTLFLSARMMARYAARKDPHVLSAFGKLADALPRSVARYVHATMAVVADGCADSRYTRVFETVANGWLEARKVRIVYLRQEKERGAETTRRVVCPLYLEPNPSGHGCYLIAFDELKQQKRIFKLERIQQAELTSERFEPPDDVNAQAPSSNSWMVSDGDLTTVRVLFHDLSAARRAVENRWHVSQQQQVGSDGRVEITFTIAGLLEITPWILSWGDAIEVLEPAELRQRVQATAESMARRYAPQPDETPPCTPEAPRAA
jgi:predicted DNA-binding transcriptional regulator YafY